MDNRFNQSNGMVYHNNPQPQIRYGSKSPIRNMSQHNIHHSHKQMQSPIRNINQNNNQYIHNQPQSPMINKSPIRQTTQYIHNQPQSPMISKSVMRQSNIGVTSSTMDNVQVQFMNDRPQHYNSVVEQQISTPSKVMNNNYQIMNSNHSKQNHNHNHNILSDNQQELIIIKDQNSNHIKIDYQIFGSNLINKLLEFHDKLMPLNRNNFMDLETVNQYDVVIQDLNQELAYKNQQIQDLQDKLNEVENHVKKENTVLRGALMNSQQLQQVNGVVDNQILQDLEHYKKQCREIEKYFQKEIQCLQGYLEIKLIGFMERIRKEYQKMINEYGVQLTQYKQNQGNIEIYKHDIISLQNSLQILNDNIRQRDQMIISLRQQQPKQVIMQQQPKQVIMQQQPKQEQQPQIDIKPYEDQIHQLQMDIQYLQEQLQNQPKQEIDHSQFDNYKQEIASLRAEMDLLRSQLDEKDGYYNIEINNYQDKIQEYENRLMIQQDEYNKLRDGINVQFKDKIQEYENRLMIQQNEYNKLRDGIDVQFKDKDNEIQQLKQNYQQLQTEIQEVHEEYEEEEIKLKEDFTNNEAKWKSKITILEQEIESLKLKLKDCQQDVKQSMEEIKNYESLVQEKTRIVYSLQEKMNEMEGSQNQHNQAIVQSRRSITDLQTININYKKELQKYKDELDDYQNQTKVYETKIKNKDRDLRELQEQMNQMMEKHQNHNTDSNLNQKLAELTRQNFQKQMELDQKQDDLLKKNLEINRFKVEINQLEETIKKQDDQIKQQRRDLEQRINDLDNHEKQQQQQMNNRAERRSVRKSVMQYGITKQQ